MDSSSGIAIDAYEYENCARERERARARARERAIRSARRQSHEHHPGRGGVFARVARVACSDAPRRQKTRRCRRSESNPRPNQDGGARARRGARAPPAPPRSRARAGAARRDLAQVLFSALAVGSDVALDHVAVARDRAVARQLRPPRDKRERATRATERKNTHAPATREGRRSKRRASARARAKARSPTPNCPRRRPRARRACAFLSPWKSSAAP